MVVLAAPGVVTPDGIRPDAAVVLEAGVVAEVRSVARIRPDVRLPAGLRAPGLVDLQVNGGFGVDLVDADGDDWGMVAGRLPETGVTAFAPTFITAALPTLADALRRAGTARDAGHRGARILGVHLEGPFLSARRRGAHDPAYLIDPTPPAVDALLAAAPDVPLMVTLAPERDGAVPAVRPL
ncbi:MAG TPA: hypothetical protein VGR21_00815, partial [Cryptosporangiaceae bacterium]|nr:hypothetical protein [Cryptosporangiaceae bacterium]